MWKNNAFWVKKLCHHRLSWLCFVMKNVWWSQIILIYKHLTAVLILGHNIVPKIHHRWMWRIKCPGLFNKGCISLTDVHTLSFLLITDVTSNPPCARATHPWFHCNDIVACRPVARQWPQNKQLQDSRCCITASKTCMFQRHLKNTAIMEEIFSLQSWSRCYEQDQLAVTRGEGMSVIQLININICNISAWDSTSSIINDPCVSFLKMPPPLKD
jgi:hypothetical protein